MLINTWKHSHCHLFCSICSSQSESKFVLESRSLLNSVLFSCFKAIDLSNTLKRSFFSRSSLERFRIAFFFAFSFLSLSTIALPRETNVFTASLMLLAICGLIPPLRTVSLTMGLNVGKSKPILLRSVCSSIVTCTFARIWLFSLNSRLSFSPSSFRVRLFLACSLSNLALSSLRFCSQPLSSPLAFSILPIQSEFCFSFDIISTPSLWM
ncbi:hypothetical protein ES703_65695 [subsurface metagenome]